MLEIFTSIVIVGLIVYGLFWLGSKMTAPLGHALQIVAAAGGFIWLLFNVREIIHAIASL